MSHRIKVNESASSLLEDALSSVTRSTRRNLIIFSVLCLIVSKTGVDPTKLRFPLFDIGKLPESYVVYGLLILTVYSFISFLMHSSSDFVRFKHKRDVYNLELARQIDSEIHTPPNLEQEHFSSMFESDTGYKSFIAPKFFTKFIYYIKLIMDFIFPLILGITAIIIFIYTRSCT